MSAKTIASLTHVQRVRLLYKTCLRLHRGLPTQMQILGDAYVKDEFRRHKEADPVQTATFMEAWAVSFEFIIKLRFHGIFLFFANSTVKFIEHSVFCHANFFRQINLE